MLNEEGDDDENDNNDIWSGCFSTVVVDDQKFDLERKKEPMIDVDLENTNSVKVTEKVEEGCTTGHLLKNCDLSREFGKAVIIVLVLVFLCVAVMLVRDLVGSIKYYSETDVQTVQNGGNGAFEINIDFYTIKHQKEPKKEPPLLNDSTSDFALGDST